MGRWLIQFFRLDARRLYTSLQTWGYGETISRGGDGEEMSLVLRIVRRYYDATFGLEKASDIVIAHCRAEQSDSKKRRKPPHEAWTR